MIFVVIRSDCFKLAIGGDTTPQLDSLASHGNLCKRDYVLPSVLLAFRCYCGSITETIQMLGGFLVVLKGSVPVNRHLSRYPGLVVLWRNSCRPETTVFWTFSHHLMIPLFGFLLRP
jgi:hypothetical protein